MRWKELSQLRAVIRAESLEYGRIPTMASECWIMPEEGNIYPRSRITDCALTSDGLLDGEHEAEILAVVGQIDPTRQGRAVEHDDPRRGSEVASSRYHVDQEKKQN